MTKSTTCVLIDDDQEEYELFSLGLSHTSLGVTCHYFQTCAEAVEFYGQDGIGVPDFIFVDGRLVEMEGKNCIAELRGLPLLEAVKMYLYSGMEYTDAENENMTQLRIGFLKKQASIAQLGEELKILLQAGNLL
ncbi:response regulator [Dyadobacter luticola]|uniref:Response regulator n=1 Tax=Dyadobacter luticola TaxID=1979387 RepID=A0A5R9L4X4_9BACT|nr:response regulator [Dyadobacter luticola]TLV03468.1 response regulator [Dyadobacter luticola]